MSAKSALGTQVEIAQPQAFKGKSSPQFRARWVRMNIVGMVSQQVGSGAFLVPIEQARLAQSLALAGVDSGEASPISSPPYNRLVWLAMSLDYTHPVP